MPDNTVTLVLNGEVSLSEFATAVANFNELIKALSTEAGASLDWIIQDLQVSSALASAMGIGAAVQVETVLAAYVDVGVSLESNTEIKHSEPVRMAANNLVYITDARIPSVRLETAVRESTIPARRQRPQIAVPGLQVVPAFRPLVKSEAAPSFGAIQGRIQTLTNRGGLRFTLFDLLYDKAVSCYFSEGKQELIRGMWGQLAIVEGLISRDPITGRPLSIRGVNAVLPAAEPSSRFDYQDARGVAPSLNGLSPEEAIRRIRDA